MLVSLPLSFPSGSPDINLQFRKIVKFRRDAFLWNRARITAFHYCFSFSCNPRPEAIFIQNHSPKSGKNWPFAFFKNTFLPHTNGPSGKFLKIFAWNFSKKFPFLESARGGLVRVSQSHRTIHGQLKKLINRRRIRNDCRLWKTKSHA